MDAGVIRKRTLDKMHIDTSTNRSGRNQDSNRFGENKLNKQSRGLSRGTKQNPKGGRDGINIGLHTIERGTIGTDSE